MSRDIIAHSDPLVVSGVTEERRARMQRVVDAFTIKAEKALRSPSAGMPPRQDIAGVIKELDEVDASLVLIADLPKHFAAAEVTSLMERARQCHAEGYFPVFYYFDGQLALFGSKAVQVPSAPKGDA